MKSSSFGAVWQKDGVKQELKCVENENPNSF